MTVSEQVRARIQAYLKDVASNLEGTPKRDAQDILRQIESHVHEALEARTGGKDAQVPDVEAVLAEMDTPESYGTSQEGSFSKIGRGRLALLISLGSLVVAGLLALLTGGRLAVWIPFFLFLGGQVAAFVIGILSWRDPFGKAAVFASAALTIIAVLFCS